MKRTPASQMRSGRARSPAARAMKTSNMEPPAVLQHGPCQREIPSGPRSSASTGGDFHHLGGRFRRMHDVLLLEGDGMGEVAHVVRGVLGDGAVVRVVEPGALASAVSERWNLLMVPIAALVAVADARRLDPTLP